MIFQSFSSFLHFSFEFFSCIIGFIQLLFLFIVTEKCEPENAAGLVNVVIFDMIIEICFNYVMVSRSLKYHIPSNLTTYYGNSNVLL